MAETAQGTNSAPPPRDDRYDRCALGTRAIHVGVDKDQQFNSVMTPIYPTSTFRFEAPGQTKGYDYTRSGNPTRQALNENLASLEGGIDAFATCTGMSAETTLLGLFNAGDEIVLGHDIYGGTYRLFSAVAPRFGLTPRFVDMRNAAQLQASLTAKTAAIWIETPSNPLLRVVDLQAIVAMAREHAERIGRPVLTIADNTFLSPVLQRPLEHGVDIVMHSTTKYLNGHSDVVGGALVVGAGPAGKQDRTLADRVGYLVNAMGTACSPFDAWLVLRGLKTLVPRVQLHCRNAQAVAEHLSAHPRVSRVYYPGLPTDESHALAKRQQDGFGGIVSLEVGSTQAQALAFATRLKLFALAESLGGVESLVDHVATMTHASMPAEARHAAGMQDNLIRLSVGLEDVGDLLSDLDAALACV